LCGIFDAIMEEDDDDITDFDLHCVGISGDILAKVVEYCNYYTTHEKMDEIKTPFKSEVLTEIVSQKWYTDFINANFFVIRELIAAANYLDIQPLLCLTLLAQSKHIKGKGAEELRRIFNVTTTM
jgi:S-phase kinase-associated protein 1